MRIADMKIRSNLDHKVITRRMLAYLKYLIKLTGDKSLLNKDGSLIRYKDYSSDVYDIVKIKENFKSIPEDYNILIYIGK
jgi:hypothetical protein